MSYTRLDLKNGTVVDESHVSHIEDGIEDCESQLDDLNTSLADLDILGERGTALASGDDLNNYRTGGKYYSSNSTMTSSIENTPFTGAGFALFVIIVSGSVTQIVLSAGSTTYRNIYIRAYTSSAWQSWYSITGSAVSTTSATAENSEE